MTTTMIQPSRMLQNHFQTSKHMKTQQTWQIRSWKHNTQILDEWSVTIPTQYLQAMCLSSALKVWE